MATPPSGMTRARVNGYFPDRLFIHSVTLLLFVPRTMFPDTHGLGDRMNDHLLTTRSPRLLQLGFTTYHPHAEYSIEYLPGDIGSVAH